MDIVIMKNENHNLIKVAYNWFVTIICLVFFNSCENKRDALGADNEIRVICSEIDKAHIQQYLKEIFIDTLYTPEPEPFYHLKFSAPETFSELKSQSQVVVATIDEETNSSGYRLIRKLLPEKDFNSMRVSNPVLISQNIYAKKQLFMIINANSIEQLIPTIDEKRNGIRKLFREHFIKRQHPFLFNDHMNESIQDSLIEKFGWDIKVPWGWEIIKIKQDSNFVWLGKEMPFQWIGIGWESGNLVNDELSAGNHIWNWMQVNYGTVRINNYKFKLDKTEFKSGLAWRAQGIWETIDLKDSKGGPFKSYMFYDDKNDKTYHLNYLIHHPGKDKSIFMRQMDMIIKTFKIIDK
tara:strand:+ start:2900 stop:3952 length:1053 start_codon:yes stop_codon:yes gene_type:complete